MSDNWLKALILACTFGAVLLLVDVLVSAAAARRSEGKAINLRLQMIGQGRTRGETLQLLRRADNRFLEMLPPFLVPAGVRFEQMMTAAQLTIPAARLFAIIALMPVAVFVLILVLMSMSGMPIGIGRLLMVGTFSFVVGFLIPIMAIQVKANRTKKKMQEQFPVALDVFVRGLRAGHPIAAALELLTVELPDPIGSEFGTVVDEVTYGADLRDALQSMAERWDMDDMRMFVVSLAVQSETGGNLAEILENLAKVIRDRASMMMKVRALSSEGRMTAIMLTGLPIFAFTMLFLWQPSFYLDVADDPAFVPGFVILIFLYLIGFITIRRMIDLKV